MTPQEQQLVAELFDRLTRLETAPRDADAERLIAEGARRAPHALYALVQTVLVQDEALKRANTRIEELQQQLEARASEQPQEQQGSFLDTMREAVFGHAAPRGSVPSVQPGAMAGSAYQSQAGFAPPRAAPGAPVQPPSMSQPPYMSPGGGFAPGGSFLGTAASAAAGVIGGGLLLDGIRSMFSHRAGAGGNDPYAFAAPADRVQPWSTETRNDDLARQAGIDDIGRQNDDAGRQSMVATRADDQDLTPAPDDDQYVDDDNFDTVDTSGDDSYDV